jgi:single-strand DNA-binding protein
LERRNINRLRKSNILKGNQIKMANFNKVILAGRLTADPELKQTPQGVSVTTFGIAINRKYKGADGAYPTDFFNIVAWRNTAEFITKHFKKGRAILLCGQLQNRSWEKDGQKHTVTEVIADEVDFADSKTDGSVSSAPASAATESYVPSLYAPQGTQGTLGLNTFSEVNDEGGLPF